MLNNSSSIGYLSGANSCKDDRVERRQNAIDFEG